MRPLPAPPIILGAELWMFEIFSTICSEGLSTCSVFYVQFVVEAR